MDRKLLDYLPPVLREVLEFQAINAANEPEISIAWDALALVLANQFLDTATASGVAVWERELNIRPQRHGHAGGPQGTHQGPVELGAALHSALAQELAHRPLR